MPGFSQFLDIMSLFLEDHLEFIRGQSVTRRSMGREAPRYQPQYPGP